MSNRSKRFPPEFRERAARMVLEEEKNHPSLLVRSDDDSAKAGYSS